MGKIKPLIVLLVCVLVITAVICIVGGIAAGAEGDKTDTEKMREMADLVGDAILSMDNSYKKQVEVVTYPLTYSDASGNTIACRIDAVNDVVSAYQWYNYRNSGMLIGKVPQTITNGEVQIVKTPENVTCKNVTVIYDDCVKEKRKRAERDVFARHDLKTIGGGEDGHRRCVHKKNIGKTERFRNTYMSNYTENLTASIAKKAKK